MKFIVEIFHFKNTCMDPLLNYYHNNILMEDSPNYADPDLVNVMVI